MKEQEKKAIELEITVTYNTKEDFEKFIESFGNMISAEQKEALSELIKERMGEGIKEAFNPKEGDILVIPGENEELVNTIFRYVGTSHTDEYGDLWLHADISICHSDDLMKPYMIIRGEDQDFLEEICRHATEEERKFFFRKTGEQPKEEQAAPKVPKLVHVVGSDSGCTNVFFPVPTIFTESKMMENKVKRGWVFQTEEECQAVCDKLNEAIKNVK